MTYADPRWLRIRRRHVQAPTQQGLAVLSEHLQTRYGPALEPMTKRVAGDEWPPQWTDMPNRKSPTQPGRPKED